MVPTVNIFNNTPQVLKVKKYIQNIFFAFCFLLFSFYTKAQYLHFSQYFNTPLSVNPANTGFIPDADYRIGGTYRNQWSTIMAQPYITSSIFGDAQLFKDKLQNGWFGIGGSILSDVAGSGSLRSTKIYASVAYHQQLGNSSLLSAGFNLGWFNKRIDQSKLKFPDQFDGEFFDNPYTAVVLLYNNVSYLDMSAGINYAYFPKENVYVNIGYSAMNVNRPQESFFTNNVDTGRVPLRHNIFINSILKVDDRVIINPNAYFSVQKGATELMFGLNGNYNLTQAGEKQLVAGLYYRVGDAFAPMVGFELNNVTFIYSYDATVSSLTKFNNFRGANEFSIVKKGFYQNKEPRHIMCPSF